MVFTYADCEPKIISPMCFFVTDGATDVRSQCGCGRFSLIKLEDPQRCLLNRNGYDLSTCDHTRAGSASVYRAMRHPKLPNTFQQCSSNFKQFVELSQLARTMPINSSEMGWNEVQQVADHPLWNGIEDRARFYFVHSYYVHAQQRSLLAGSVDYGIAADAALARDNLFAVQFHPEKSADAGLKLLKNFLEWNGQC